MPAVEIIERLLKGELGIRKAPDEATWHAIWRDEGLGSLAPPDCALVGGILADRLPWVFVAGYQAAIRTVFPEVPAEGWAAFAATEDGNDPDANAGPQLTPSGGCMLLNAAKSWIGQSLTVEHLVVTARVDDGDPKKPECVLVRRNQPGVTLTHREAPRFLGAMSQGYALFENVEVAPQNVLSGDRIRLFARNEPVFVMLAGAGFLLSQLNGADETLECALVGLTLALAAASADPATTPMVIARLDQDLHHCIDRFAEAAEVGAIPNWAEDNRLLSMYSERLQKRGRPDR